VRSTKDIEVAIEVRCNNCEKRLNAPAAAAGKTMKCPDCGAGIQIPAAGEASIAIVTVHKFVLRA
jgi:ribosomal protein S27E